MFPRSLNWFAIIIGAAGILSVVPPLLDIAVPVYALGQIIWWIWIAVVLLKNPGLQAQRAQ